jgi:hypothetical protein
MGFEEWCVFMGDGGWIQTEIVQATAMRPAGCRDAGIPLGERSDRAPTQHREWPLLFMGREDCKAFTRSQKLSTRRNSSVAESPADGSIEIDVIQLEPEG